MLGRGCDGANTLYPLCLKNHYLARVAVKRDPGVHKSKIMDSKSENELQETTEKLMRDLRAVVQDGEELLRAGAHELSEKGMAARERLAAALDSAKETGRKLQERTVAGARATDRVIREHPYQSIGIAFGVGLLIGVLVNRK